MKLFYLFPILLCFIGCNSNLKKAENLYQKALYSEAIPFFERHLEKDSVDFSANLKLAICKLNNGKRKVNKRLLNKKYVLNNVPLPNITSPIILGSNDKSLFVKSYQSENPIYSVTKNEWILKKKDFAINNLEYPIFNLKTGQPNYFINSTLPYRSAFFKSVRDGNRFKNLQKQKFEADWNKNLSIHFPFVHEFTFQKNERGEKKIQCLIFSGRVNSSFDLFYSIKDDENGYWGEPINLKGLNSSIGDELFPFVDLDDILYYSTNGRIIMPDSGNSMFQFNGGFDIYYAEPDSIFNEDTLQFKLPKIHKVSTYGNDFSIFSETADAGYAGYFSSDFRNGEMELYAYEMSPDVGNNYAIFIANDFFNHESWLNKEEQIFKFTIEEVKRMDSVIRKYNFEDKNITNLFNKPKQEIFDTLTQVFHQLNAETDRLFVIISTHGTKVDSINGNYLIPANGIYPKDRRTTADEKIETWIEYGDFFDLFEGKAKSTLMLVDACFVPNLNSSEDQSEVEIDTSVIKTKGGDLKYNSYKIEQLKETPSYRIMSPGTEDLVPESSSMINSFYNELKKNKSPAISTEEIFFNTVRWDVKGDNIRPQFIYIGDSNQGDFIFELE